MEAIDYYIYCMIFIWVWRETFSSLTISRWYNVHCRLLHLNEVIYDTTNKVFCFLKFHHLLSHLLQTPLERWVKQWRLGVHLVESQILTLNGFTSLKDQEWNFHRQIILSLQPGLFKSGKYWRMTKECTFVRLWMLLAVWNHQHIWEWKVLCISPVSKLIWYTRRLTQFKSLDSKGTCVHK